jgi:IclR family transcriptional regulator, acetate operon repressor
MSERRGVGIEGAALRAAVAGHDQEPRELLTSAERALRALELIAAAPGPLPAKALAQQLGTSLGTSYRVLHTLEHEGYAVRLGHGCYGLGPKLSELCLRFQERLDPAEVARPMVAALADSVEEDGYLAVVRGGEVAVTEVVRASRRLHLDEPGVGFARVAHATAIGKVLLAACPSDTADDYLGARHLVPCTPYTLVDRRAIKQDLAETRKRGYAVQLEELAVGCCCVAAPVLDADGATVASIGLSVPVKRFRAERRELIRRCRETAARASRALGSTGRTAGAQEELRARPSSRRAG